MMTGQAIIIQLRKRQIMTLMTRMDMMMVHAITALALEEAKRTCLTTSAILNGSRKMKARIWHRTAKSSLELLMACCCTKLNELGHRITCSRDLGEHCVLWKLQEQTPYLNNHSTFLGVFILFFGLVTKRWTLPVAVEATRSYVLDP